MSKLTKSEFKIWLDCPHKLRHKRRGMPSAKSENAYLEFFAECGFMVEALAHALFPSGIRASSSPDETAEESTGRLLAVSGDGVWFEPTFTFDGMSARVDILRRTNGRYELIEIKAKSFDPVEDSSLLGKRGDLRSEWEPYVWDVAFQAMVVSRSLGVSVKPFLCLVDKSKTCNEDQIFNKIKIESNSVDFLSPRAVFTGDGDALLQDPFLHFKDVSQYVDSVSSQVLENATKALLADQSEGEYGAPPLSSKCRDCEFRHKSASQSGFVDCWGSDENDGTHIVDLYYSSSLVKGGDLSSFAKSGRTSIGKIDINEIDKSKARGKRQLLQIQAFTEKREVVLPELRECLEGLEEPYYFLDFETSRIPVPYHVGMNPFEQVPFQFSCHVLQTATSQNLEHHEWINIKDVYPSVEFVKQVKAVIGETGTVFVWSPFEQSALKDIVSQDTKYGNLESEDVDWLVRTGLAVSDGGRVMDLMKLCQNYYCHPMMLGKVSVKYVLKSIWSSNQKLWIDPWFNQYYKVDDEGKVIDPYLALPEVPFGFESEAADAAVDAVREGVGAMKAYQEMMYGLRREDHEFRELQKELLLQYCKLDTVAMVMIWKHWMGLLRH